MSLSEWIYYMIEKNPDVDRDIIVENAGAFIANSGKKFSDFTEEELKNAEIV